MEKVDFDRYKDACCYMTPDELKKYVDNTISIWGDINKQNIKQIISLVVYLCLLCN